MSNKILVVDPGYGGGIRQGSIYLHEYLLRKGYDSRFLELKDGNNTPCVLDLLRNIYDSFSPNLVIVHEYQRFEVFSYLRLFYPEILFAFFSLPSPDMEEYHYKSKPIDVILTPGTFDLSHPKSERWMFDMPERFYQRQPSNKREKNSIVYAGRVEQEKFSKDLIHSLESSQLKVDAYGSVSIRDREYYDAVRNSKALSLKGEIPNYNIERVFGQYEMAVLASETDCFCLYMVEAILSGCYPFIMIEDYRKRYPWMWHDLVTYSNERDMVLAMKDFMSFDEETKGQMQQRVRDRLVAYLKDVSDISVIENFLKEDAKEISYYSNNYDDLESVAEYGWKY